jgi:hypothetical protein
MPLPTMLLPLAPLPIVVVGVTTGTVATGFGTTTEEEFVTPIVVVSALFFTIFLRERMLEYTGNQESRTFCPDALPMLVW